jgi:tetratricopeptide (TPR) repeat protein
MEQARYAEALELLTALVKQSPEEFAYRQGRATCYFQLNQFADAAFEFRILTTLVPENPEFIFQTGNSYEQLDSLRLAVKYYSESIQQQPDNALYYFKRGTVHLKQSRWVPAIKDMSEAIALNADYDNAYHNRAIASYKIGEELQACNDWCRAALLGNKISVTHLERNCKRYPFNCGE